MESPCLFLALIISFRVRINLGALFFSKQSYPTSYEDILTLHYIDNVCSFNTVFSEILFEDATFVTELLRGYFTSGQHILP